MLRVCSDPASMQQTLERITPEMSNIDEKSNAPLHLDTKTSIYGQTQRTNVQLHLRDRPISTITASQSAQHSQATAEQPATKAGGIETATPIAAPGATAESVATTEVKAFSVHMGRENGAVLKVSDQRSSNLTA